MTHRELGAKILKKLTLDLAELADVEVFPKMEGYQMFTIFNPKKAKVADAKKVSTTDSIEADDVAPKIKKAPKEQKVKAPKPEPKDDDEIF